MRISKSAFHSLRETGITEIRKSPTVYFRLGKSGKTAILLDGAEVIPNDFTYLYDLQQQGFVTVEL
jgi:hypothetical protein